VEIENLGAQNFLRMGHFIPRIGFSPGRVPPICFTSFIDGQYRESVSSVGMSYLLPDFRPLLVTMLAVKPELRPYSALKWLV
jgi:hypothetical protein